MGKLCCIFNIPSLYREAIYMDIDHNYDCEWFFEKEENDINLFDISKLGVSYVLEHKNFVSRAYRMKGLIGKTWNRKDIDAYLVIGAPMCLSIWGLCLLLNIFHPKKKIYFWCHGWYGKESRSEAFIKKLFMKLADEYFIYGNYAKKHLVKQGFEIKKLHVIHNSLSYEVQLKIRDQLEVSEVYKKYFKNDNPTMIFIGRLTPIKRLDILIDALAMLKDRGKEYNLVLVGDGKMKNKLEDQVRSLHLESQCWFYGACYDETVNAQLIYNADLCVSPGNVGLTAIHSLMFGTPVITHNNFAYQMPEFEAIHPSETGDFFKQNDLEDLVLKISLWFEKKQDVRNSVRLSCFQEIDEQWNPTFQMKVIKSVITNNRKNND